MAKQWRPKWGWPINPCENCARKVEDNYGLFCDWVCGEVAANANFEAGADAMLGMLRAKGKFTYGCHTPDIDLADAPEASGYWVFIPEEE